MKGLIRLIQAILTVIWLGTLALSVLLCTSARDGELPGVSKWSCFVVADPSMEPELAPGDLAVITMGKEAQPGDEILYKDSAGGYAITRIIGTTEGQLILKADNQDSSRLASPEEALGVCEGYLPGFGEPFKFLCSIAGIIVIAIAGLVLIVLPGSLLRTPVPPKRRTARPEASQPARPRPAQRTQDVPQRSQRPRPVQRPAAQHPAEPRTAERPQPRQRTDGSTRQTRPSSRGGYTPRH